MNNKPPSGIEIFERLVKKFGNGERRDADIKGFRDKCDLTIVKLFPDKNGIEKNKACLFFNADAEGYSIVFASCEPKNGKDPKALVKINPSRKSGEPNISFEETSCGVSRVSRSRSDYDEYGFEARNRMLLVLLEVNSIMQEYALSRKDAVEAKI